MENPPMTGNGRADLRCAALVLAGVLLCATPAQAGTLAASGANAGSAGNALKKNLTELTDKFGKAMDATITGDDARVRKLWREVEKSPGRIATEAFPVFKAVAGAKKRAKSAAKKIERFVGRAGDKASAAKEKVGRLAADPRAALAVGRKERPLYESKTGILGGGPLPKAKGAAVKVEPAGADPHAAAGVVLDEVQKFGRCHEGRAYRRGTDKYNFYRNLLESQRNAPWRPCMPGKPNVKKPGKAEKKETAGKAQDGGDAAQREYEAALARTLGETGSGDYNSALGGLEAKEAARRKEEARRLAAAKERKRQARLARERKRREEARKLAAAEERKRKARLARERRLAAQRAREREEDEYYERRNRRLDALEAEQRRQAFRNVVRSLQDFANQAGGVYGGGQPSRGREGSWGERCSDGRPRYHPDGRSTQNCGQR